ncbi:MULTISPECIES: hypothetical protein [unclassified Streptomyces]|uniref:hypothetical protein n=1 Tax=unclassified Streptomyces TaxID=2593676 RepID=UPI00081ED37D|nr:MULTISPECIES: hypothetical protein [unclassified Streptomyces]MYR28720.1 hypothetical protein [Streptomyces sp. SID4945]SCF40724.1 hypothetical protein GA0115257_11578 [Streptomyces sp. LcepLS]
MILALIAYPLLALLAAVGLAVLAPGEPFRWLLPAVRITVPLLVAVGYVSFIWGYAT